MVDAKERSEEPEDLAGIVSRYRRHVPLILALVVALIAVAAIVTNFLPKRYTATAEINYKPQQTTNVITGQKDPGLTDQARDAQIEAAVQAISASSVGRRVIESLGLQKDPEIVNTAAQFNTPGLDPNDALAAALLSNVKVRRVGQTALIDISYTDKRPAMAQKIANALTKAFAEDQIQMKLAQIHDSDQQSGQQIDAFRKDVERADAAVAAYRASHNLVTSVDAPGAGQELATVNQALADARAAEAESAARLASVSRSGGREGAVDQNEGSAASQLMSDLRSQKAQVSRKMAEISARYGPRHPDVIEAQSELHAIDQQIREEQDRAIKVASAQAAVARQRSASLAASQSATMQRLQGNIAANVMLSDLESRARNARQVYETALAHAGQAATDKGTVLADFTVSSAADLPLKPSFPNLAINIALGAVAGLGIGIGIAFLRERWSIGLNTIDDVDRLLDQNYLNTIPTLASAIDSPKTQDPLEAIVEHPLSLFAEAYRSLAASLIYADRGNPAKIIGLTSALPKEGKSTTATSMARVLAMSGTKVLLMDCDLRRRSATMQVAPDAEAGLIEVLNGSAPLEKVILADTSGAAVLPLAPRSHLAGQPFDTPEFEKLMAQLRQSYDVIVVDTAPVLAVVDTRLLLRHLDALGLLARWRSTPIKAIRAALHQVESVGGNVTGVAMTFVNLKTQAQSGYGDASYYYREMKDYYATAG